MEGKTICYGDGYAVGETIGYANGLFVGYDQGYEEGYLVGELDGYGGGAVESFRNGQSKRGMIDKKPRHPDDWPGEQEQLARSSVSFLN